MALLPVNPAHCGRAALQAQRPSGDGDPGNLELDAAIDRMSEPREDSPGSWVISTVPADVPTREAIIRLSRPFARDFVAAVEPSVSPASVTDAHARTARKYPDM